MNTQSFGYLDPDPGLKPALYFRRKFPKIKFFTFYNILKAEKDTKNQKRFYAFCELRILIQIH
jgi:hypothetical protein